MLVVLHVAHSRQVSEGKIERLRENAGLQVHLVRSTRTPTRFDGTLRVPVGKSSDPHRCVYGTFAFGLHRFRPDIVHVEEEPDSLAALQVALARRAWAKRARLVYHSWQNVRRELRPGVRALLAVTLRSADAILCASRKSEQVWRSMGFTGLTRTILPQGVDVSRFAPRPDPPVHDHFSVGYVGRLVAEKGCDTLLDAVAALAPPVELTLVGDGPERRPLEGRAAALGLAARVRFTGRLPHEAMPSVLAGFDVVVLPSRTTPVWEEQFGRVLAEAMACAVSAVGSDSGAIPEVIGDAGLTFPEGDAAALAQCLRALRESPSLRRQLGQRGRERAIAEFSEATLARQTAAFYKELAGTQESGPRARRATKSEGRTAERGTRGATRSGGVS